MRLAWYWRRLRIMSAAELGARVWQVLRDRRRRWTRRDPRPAAQRVVSYAFCRGDGLPLELPVHCVAIDGGSAERLLAGHWQALAWPWQWQGDAACWHRAPDTGRLWPLLHFSRLDCRPGNAVGDARVVWEPARLQWLVELGLLAREPRYAAQAAGLVERVVEQWLAANPPYRGVHYGSAMECALRMLAVCYALDLVRPHLREPLRTWSAALDLIDSHAQLIAGRLSAHSSAGNHTLAEAAALVHAGELFPEFGWAAAARTNGVAIFAREFRRQVLPDGGGIEQAPAYLHLITDLAELTEMVVRRSGGSLELGDRIAAAREFLQDLGDAGIGDCDDGVALVARLAFPQVQRATARPVRTYPDSGYTVLRAKDGAARLVFDHGPLGMLPGCGHGHADGLAVLLELSGRWVLTDTGTYGYGLDPAARARYRGTRAHNTVMLDGTDQAIQTGPFLWRDAYPPACCRLLREHPVSVLLARGGARPQAGVAHWRGIVLGADGNLLVRDQLLGTGRHEVEINWHLGVPLETAGAGRFVAREAGIAIDLRGLPAELVEWPRAPRYGVTEPGRCVRGTIGATLPVEIRTFVHVGGSLHGAFALERWLADLDHGQHGAGR